jgi:hypothetical protein
MEEYMFRLAAMIYVLAATALSGSAVIAVLTMRMVSAWEILAATVVGAIVALPVAWLIAKQILANIRPTT